MSFRTCDVSCHQTPDRTQWIQGRWHRCAMWRWTMRSPSMWTSVGTQKKIEISSPGAPTFARTRWPQRDHSKRFAAYNGFPKWFSWSTILDHQIVAIFSLKNAPIFLNISWEISDIHQAFVGFSAGRTSTGAEENLVFFSAFKRVPSPWPYTPLHRWPSCFFSLGKLFKTGSKWVPTDIHATCFRGKSCSSVQVKDVLCPTRWLEQCSCFNFEMQTLDFQTARIQGASQGI